MSSNYPHKWILTMGSYKGLPFATGSFLPHNKKTEIYEFGNHYWKEAKDYPYNDGEEWVFELILHVTCHMNFGLHRCWWRMLETKCVGDKFEMLVTDLIHWKKHQHNEKSHQHHCHWFKFSIEYQTKNSSNPWPGVRGILFLT